MRINFSLGHGKLRINKIENVGRALQFLVEKKVHLENLGPEDIVDGNPRLILGLVWTLILRFQVQDIALQVSKVYLLLKYTYHVNRKFRMHFLLFRCIFSIIE